MAHLEVEGGGGERERKGGEDQERGNTLGKEVRKRKKGMRVDRRGKNMIRKKRKVTHHLEFRKRTEREKYMEKIGIKNIYREKTYS